MALNGQLASYDVPALQGLQAEVSVLNANGGVNGHKVVFVYRNDESNPADVTPALQSLLGQHTISYLLPELIPNFQSSMLPYTKQKQIITASSTDGPGLFDAKTNPYNFQTYPSTGVVAAEVAAIQKIHGGKDVKLAIINDGDSAQTAFTTSVGSSITSDGGKVTYTTTVDPTATDVSLEVGKAQTSGADFLLLQSAPPTCIAGANGVQTVGWKVPILVPASCMNASVLTTVPASLASNYFALGQRTYLRDAATNGPPPSYNAFLKALKKTGPVRDLAVSADAADTEAIAAWGMQKAKSLSGPAVAKVLNTTSKTQLPKGLLLTLPNPPWTSSDHTFDNANLSKFWALMKPGKPVNGTYNGQALTVPG
jgi:branched-chain amino acid transport system substrate-binding protein